jgi:3-phosphoshikimate 1-carboxyvinyltransferase
MSPNLQLPESVPSTARAVRLHPVTGLEGVVRLPGSKSMTNRALLMAALARGRSVLRNALDCDDSRHMIEALRRLGVAVTCRREEATIVVEGVGGPFPVRQGTFNAGNAGTTVRFLTAVLAACGGDYVVDGDERMRARPIGDLVRALATLGADISAPSGCPPVKIGPRPFVGGQIDIPGSTSSQFISAILLAAPLAEKRVKVRVTGELVSRPYIDLTIAAMRDFGARVFADDRRADGQPLFEVQTGRLYEGRDYSIEGDASTASYFFAAAALTGGTLRVEGVGKVSPQGDARAADVLAAMGCRVKKERDAITVTGPRPPAGFLRGVDWNCAEIPDVVPTLATVALFASGRTRLRGVAHLRHKESDRLRSVASELHKLGGEVKELRDGLEIEGTLGPRPSPLRGALVDPWADHRLAMALSVAGLVLPGIVIREPGVVAKSFPGFFDALRGLGVRVEFLEEEPPAAARPAAPGVASPGAERR